MTFTLTSLSPQQTRDFGRTLGALLRPGDLICLQGDLGAGKTTLTQGIAQGWSSADPVSSPTFVLINTYRSASGLPLYHLDAYRLESLPEAEQLGLDDLLAEGALIVEWPEQIEPLLPPQRLWLTIEPTSLADERALTLTAHGARAEAICQTLSPNNRPTR